MVQSKAATIDEWLDGVDAERRPAFACLREIARAELPGWEERMEWGMPGYGPPGAPNAFSFNAQKRHIALYAGPTAVERFADRLAGLDCGKGCIRYSRPEAIDWDVVRAVLGDIRARDEAMCAPSSASSDQPVGR